MPLVWSYGRDGQNTKKGTMVNATFATLSQMMKPQLACERLNAAATSEWSDPTALLLRLLRPFGVHAASWRHCELYSQSLGHLQITQSTLQE